MTTNWPRVRSVDAAVVRVAGPLCDARDVWSISDEKFIRVARSDREPPGQAALDLRSIVETMPPVPYALEVPNDVRRQELGVERFVGLVREAAETCFDRIDAEPAGTVG